MRGRPGGLEAAALVDRDVDQHGAVAHTTHQLITDQLRSLGPYDEDRTDDDVGVEADLLDGMSARRHRLQCATEVVVDLAQAFEVAVEDVDLGVHAHGEGGRRHAGHPGSEDHDLRAAHPGDPADQGAPAATGAHQMVRAHEGGHAAGHLAHRGEQRKGIVGKSHRLIGDGCVAAGDQGVGAGARGGEVQVGEEDLVLAKSEPRILLGDRFLDTEHEVGGGPDVVGVVDDRGTGGHEVGVGNRRADTGPPFDQDGVTCGGQFTYTGRGDRHPVLVVLHFFGNTDNHWIDLTARALMGKDGSRRSNRDATRPPGAAPGGRSRDYSPISS